MRVPVQPKWTRENWKPCYSRMPSVFLDSGQHVSRHNSSSLFVVGFDTIFHRIPVHRAITALDGLSHVVHWTLCADVRCNVHAWVHDRPLYSHTHTYTKQKQRCTPKSNCDRLLAVWRVEKERLTNNRPSQAHATHATATTNNIIDTMALYMSKCFYNFQNIHSMFFFSFLWLANFSRESAVAHMKYERKGTAFIIWTRCASLGDASVAAWFHLL